MKQNIFKRLALAAVLLLSAATATAQSLEVDGIYYKVNNDGTTVSVTYKGEYDYSYKNEYTGSVSIPASVTIFGRTYSVTSIDNNAFCDCDSLTSVQIPNSVTSIGEYAFAYCDGLTTVSIGNSVTSIGEYAFRFCDGLKTLSIPNSVINIGTNAFEGNWEKLVFEDGDKEIWPRSSFHGSVGTDYSYLVIDNIFSGCVVDSLYMGRNFESPGHYDANNNEMPGLFEDSFDNLTNVEIGDSVTYISEYLFEGCYNLKSLKIGRNLSEIKYESFNGCHIEKVELSDLAAWCKVLGAFYLLPQVASIYLEGEEIEDLVIPSSVTDINYGVFYGCKFKTVTIGNNVTAIQAGAFEGCTNLKKVNITDLTAWCNIDFNDNYSNPLFSAHHLWLNGEEIIDLILPESISTIKNNTFCGCSSLKSVKIPNSVTSIGDWAFKECSGLTSVAIPNSVTSIGNNAFYECSGLTAVEIPNSVTSIGYYAFYGCSGLTAVSIGNEVSSIGSGAFSSCYNLKMVLYNAKNSISDSYICNESGCTIVIGENVEQLPDNLLEHTSWRIVSHATTPPVITSKTFSTTSCPLYVPKDSYAKYWTADVWGEFSDMRQIENLVTKIELNKDDMNLATNSTVQLTATITPDNATLKDIYWSSDAPAVASVDQSGNVQGLKSGTATITAMAIDGSGVKATCQMSVGEIIAETLTLNPSELTLEINQSANVTPVTTPENISNKAVEWSASGTNVAVFRKNSDGSITVLGVANGVTTITCRTTDGSGLSATCYVEVGANQNENFNALNELIAYAEDLYNNSTEGENIGQYAPGARAELLAAINNVKPRISDTMTADEITECTNTINDAIVLFESKKVTTIDNTDLSQYENVMYVEGADGYVGSEVTLSLKMNNAIEAVGFQCDFYAPEGTEVALDEYGFHEIYLSTERTTANQTNMFDFAAQPDGAIRILASSTKVLPFSGNTGEVATIKLNIGSDVADGDYPLILQNVVISDALGNTYKVDYVKTTLSVSSYMLGDANGDGDVNIADFSAIANYILGNQQSTFIVSAADTNQDGCISVPDLSGLVQIILSGGDTSNAPIKMASKVLQCEVDKK